TITQIPVTFKGNWQCDSCPGGIAEVGYQSAGFSATISTGDVVVVRFQAPPGKEFIVHKPASAEGRFEVSSYWWTGASDMSSHLDPHTVKFEGLRGTPPTETYSLVSISDGGSIVNVWKEYAVQGDFEFTALEVDITASHALVAAPRTFSGVYTNSVPSWN